MWVRIKLFLFRIFLKGRVVYFEQNWLIVLNFFFLNFTITFVVELIFWGLVYFVLDYRSINFFMITKMRKILELQIFL